MNCKVMGILNVTPDSFSDGGAFVDTEKAIHRAKEMLLEGADIIDIGGESTRPDATPISWKDEWERIEGVVTAIAPTAPISVDTYHPETAERALMKGAKIVNCVMDEAAVTMLGIVRKFDAELIVGANSAVAKAREVYIDPMIGFGTTREQDLALLKAVAELSRRGRVVVGASRKRIVKSMTGEDRADQLLGGNLAIALWCAMSGASMVRVHEVKETAQALRVWKQLQ